MMRTTDFLIIGGGVIGMMTAWQLAEAGHHVTLIERGECGREASWAGGGIVSPLYPWRYSEPVSRLSHWAEGYYPALAKRLADETGIDPEYRQMGLLYLGVKGESQAQAWSQRMGKPLERVGADVLYVKEPYLADGFVEGLWMPTLGSIRNPRLCRALRARLLSLDQVELREGVEVQALRCTRGRLLGVDTSHGTFGADRTILCGGAWTGQILTTVGIDLPVRPVKGQMMLFKTPPMKSRMLVERVVLMNGRYLIPRADGRLLIGSTLEEAGFDKTITENARNALLKSALDMVPALADCEIERQWAGLRPGAPDGVPFIGPAPGIDNLFINAGHYRNGLVLAPAATRLLVDQLLDRLPIVDPEPYRLPDTRSADRSSATLVGAG
ncbi:glycine oxidase ThiO [Salinisphaera aquimarina]